MSDDVKTLREYADAFEDDLANTISNPDIVIGDLLRVSIIFARRLADSIEREEARGCFECGAELLGPICPKCNPEVSPDALQAAEDRGWNAALAEADERMRVHQSKWQAGSVFFEHFTDAIRDVRALRRGASS